MKSLGLMLTQDGAIDGDEYTDLRGMAWVYRETHCIRHVEHKSAGRRITDLASLSSEGWTRTTPARVKVRPLVLRGWVLDDDEVSPIFQWRLLPLTEDWVPAYDEHGAQLTKTIYVEDKS